MHITTLNPGEVPHAPHKHADEEVLCLKEGTLEAFEDGQTTRVVAPVALLRGGHSALFTWILTRAPQAHLDKGSQKTMALLKTRGLIRRTRST
jgi:hypothetical protein